jgi:hypothetical protein
MINNNIPREIHHLIHHTEGVNSKWGRIDCQWMEDKENGDVTQLEHHFFPLINKTTGDIYLDCSKRKIYVKFIVHSIIRPVLILGKTLYHAAFFISIPHIIAETIARGKKNELAGGEIAKQCVKNSFKSLADIIRTPLYGVAMEVVSATALIVGPLAPRTLYTLREAIGALVRSLNWNDRQDYMNDLFMCFQPIKSIDRMIKTAQRDNRNPVGYIQIQLNQYAENNIKFRRENRTPFNDCYRLVDPNVEYSSPSYKKIEGISQ